MDRMMTGAVFNIGEISRKMRKGFIKGCHAYEAGFGMHSKLHGITNAKEAEGFNMGWQGRYVDEVAGLEPAVIGDDGGCFVPDDIWLSR